MSDEQPLEPAPASGYQPIWKDELPVIAPSAGDTYGSLVTSSAPVLVHEDRAIGGLPLALLAGAAAARLAGGPGGAPAAPPPHHAGATPPGLTAPAPVFAFAGAPPGPV